MSDELPEPAVPFTPPATPPAAATSLPPLPTTDSTWQPLTADPAPAIPPAADLAPDLGTPVSTAAPAPSPAKRPSWAGAALLSLAVGITSVIGINVLSAKAESLGGTSRGGFPGGGFPGGNRNGGPPAANGNTNGAGAGQAPAGGFPAGGAAGAGGFPAGGAAGAGGFPAGGAAGGGGFPAPGGGNGAGGFPGLSGTISAISGATISVKLADGTVIPITADSTTVVSGQGAAKVSDLKVGETVSVTAGFGPNGPSATAITVTG